MSLDQLAQALGIARDTLWRWEQGRLTMRHPEVLRMALDKLMVDHIKDLGTIKPGDARYAARIPPTETATSVAPKDLGEIFALQDAVVPHNRAAAPAEFQLIERGLVLAQEVTLWLNEEPVLTQRRAKPELTAFAETICANLLYAGWASLISATRLALYGDHVDAHALVRAAFEAAYHADYFRRHPGDVKEWDAAGQITDLDERRKYLLKFEHRKRVRRTLEGQYGDRSLSRFFNELSTYGSHANPATVALRLSSAVAGVANVGFVSVGKAEATLLCASNILHTLGYVLSEFYDTFPDYLERNLRFVTPHEEFRSDWDALRSAAPRELSLLR